MAIALFGGNLGETMMMDSASHPWGIRMVGWIDDYQTRAISVRPFCEIKVVSATDGGNAWHARLVVHGG